MNQRGIAALAVAGAIALGVTVSVTGSGAPTRLITNTPGMLSGSGLIANPVSMAAYSDGTTMTGSGSSGDPFSVSARRTTIRNNFGLAWFGLGYDGAGSMDGSTTVAGIAPTGSSPKIYTATRDLHFTSLTVSSGVHLRMSGWRLFVQGSLVNNGSINDSAFGTASGTSWHGTGSLPAAIGGGGATNQCGGTGQASTSAYSFATASSNALLAGSNADVPMRGGRGGNTVAAGGLGTISLHAVEGYEAAMALYRDLPERSSATQWTTGTGGSTGGCSSCSNGWGGGGNAGGTLWVAAKSISGNGVFGADGANGAAATLTQCGGGGGGGGGAVVIFYGTWSGPTTSAAGGTGGAGIAGSPPITTPNGGNGSAGFILLHNLSGDGT